MEFFDSINDLVNQHKASLVNARGNVEPNSRMEVIKSFAEQYCRMERKIGREKLNELISTIRNEEFCKRTFCDIIENVEDCFQICKDNGEHCPALSLQAGSLPVWKGLKKFILIALKIVTQQQFTYETL